MDLEMKIMVHILIYDIDLNIYIKFFIIFKRKNSKGRGRVFRESGVASVRTHEPVRGRRSADACRGEEDPEGHEQYSSTKLKLVDCSSLIAHGTSQRIICAKSSLYFQ